MSRIVIEYGFFPRGQMQWGLTSRNTSPTILHICPAEPYVNTALCGVSITAGTLHSGELCAKCAQAHGITSPDDLDSLPEEVEWMRANMKGDQ